LPPPLPPQRAGGYLGDPTPLAHGDLVWLWDREAQAWSNVVRCGTGEGSLSHRIVRLLVTEAAAKTGAPTFGFLTIRDPDGAIRALYGVVARPGQQAETRRLSGDPTLPLSYETRGPTDEAGDPSHWSLQPPGEAGDPAPSTGPVEGVPPAARLPGPVDDAVFDQGPLLAIWDGAEQRWVNIARTRPGAAGMRSPNVLRASPPSTSRRTAGRQPTPRSSIAILRIEACSMWSPTPALRRRGNGSPWA